MKQKLQLCSCIGSDRNFFRTDGKSMEKKKNECQRRKKNINLLLCSRKIYHYHLSLSLPLSSKSLYESNRQEKMCVGVVWINQVGEFDIIPTDICNQFCQRLQLNRRYDMRQFVVKMIETKIFKPIVANRPNSWQKHI